MNAINKKNKIHRYYCLHCELKLEVSEEIEHLGCLTCSGTLTKVPRTQLESIELLKSFSEQIKNLQNFQKQLQKGIGTQQQEILELKAELGRKSLHHEI